MLVDDLSAYPEPMVLGALKRVRAECRGKLTVADILSRIDDGRPGADEAWAMLPWDEDMTAVLPGEAMVAMGVARHAYLAGDKHSARLAFREKYQELVGEARRDHKPVDWQVTLGIDPQGRRGPIEEAVRLGRLPDRASATYLPPADRPSIEPSRGGGLVRVGAFDAD